MCTLMLRRVTSVFMLALALPAFAQTAGEVEYSRGVAFAQAPGQLPRAMGRGLPLQEGDRLTTAEGATTIVKLQDGTRMTVRPNSDIVMQRYRYREGASDNSMLMQLLRGGLRAVTGLISKGAPDAARIQTTTATVGIRGTDFDVRLCGAECRAESARVKEPGRPNAVLASAKLVTTLGEVYAQDPAGARRPLVVGASVYAGETVITGAGARVVLAFRDESRTTLGANTQLKVDAFVFDAANPKDGRFLVSLLRGSLRALTGLIGKSNNRNVSFTTPTATVGIRGTGLDADCSAPESCSFFTWLGSIEVGPNGQTALQTLQAGQGLVVGKSGISPLNSPTLGDLPRPDTVPVNMQQLFGSGAVGPDEDGLFVYVRDGYIEVVTLTGTLPLGRGETGFAGMDGRLGRPATIPLFIQADRTPRPDTPSPALAGLLDGVGGDLAGQCR